MSKFLVDPEYMEKCIIKSALSDKAYCILISDKFLSDYFENDSAGELFVRIKNHMNEFKTVPQQEILINSIKDKDARTRVAEFLKEINSIEFESESEDKWLHENTNFYLQEKALKHAIMKSIDVIEEKGDSMKIKEYVEEALCKDLNVDLGLDYFGDMKTRIERILKATENKIKTFFPLVDELINGGLPAYTLSV